MTYSRYFHFLFLCENERCSVRGLSNFPSLSSCTLLSYCHLQTAICGIKILIILGHGCDLLESRLFTTKTTVCLTILYYSALKNKEILAFAITWINVKLMLCCYHIKKKRKINIKKLTKEYKGIFVGDKYI